jgi:hypothetical protein
MKVTGKIKKVLDTQSGTSKEGKDWKKTSFLLETPETYNNLYCFEVFGDEKVDNFLKYNKVGDIVDVEFNVKTNEWKGKYFTSLDAWKVFKAANATETTEIETKFEDVSGLNDDDSLDLPF